MENLKKLENEIKTTKSKIHFSLKFARLGILKGVYNLIDFDTYLKIEGLND